jgi:hypothetical protein
MTIHTIILSIVLFPISIPYWFAWSLIEIIREKDGTTWSENPLTIKCK